MISTKFPTLDPDLKTVPGRSLAKGPILTLFSILTFSRCENEKSTIGAGSVITKNVKKNSLALTRSNQNEVKNYKRKK